MGEEKEDSAISLYLSLLPCVCITQSTKISNLPSKTPQHLPTPQKPFPSCQVGSTTQSRLLRSPGCQRKDGCS